MKKENVLGISFVRKLIRRFPCCKPLFVCGFAESDVVGRPQAVAYCLKPSGGPQYISGGTHNDRVALHQRFLQNIKLIFQGAAAFSSSCGHAHHTGNTSGTGLNVDQLPDERSFKKRVGALLSVGGAMTKNWLSFMLPTMYEFTMSMGIDVIDMHEYHGAMAYEHVLGNEGQMERMKKMGRNIAAALTAEGEKERTRWRGEEEGICPVCHCDMLTVSKDRSSVECPVCGIYGELECRDGRIQARFSEAEQQRSRLRWDGKLEHSTEIKTKAVGPGQIPNLQELKKPYIGYAE